MTPKRQTVAHPISKKSVAGIALGSNLNQPVKQCQLALSYIQDLPDSELLACSSFYETPPLKLPEQKNMEIPLFINAVCLIQTSLSVHDLFAHLMIIEQKMGRQRFEKWGPRQIDLDLLFFDDVVVDTETLNVPHPEMEKRSFVLIPLAEICPQWKHPISGVNIAELVRKNKDTPIQRLPIKAFSALKS